MQMAKSCQRAGKIKFAVGFHASQRCQFGVDESDTIREPHLRGGRWCDECCAVIVVVVPVIQSGMEQLLRFDRARRRLPMSFNNLQQQPQRYARHLWDRMQQVAKPLSQISFFLLFASIGVSADLAGAIRAGPACLFLSLTAMLLHLILTIGGSLLVRRASSSLLPRRLRTLTSSIRLDDVLTASNACIGGPATAAAFCNRLQDKDGSSHRQKGLTYAAVVWGVTGYAIGTSIGILFYRLLGFAFPTT